MGDFRKLGVYTKAVALADDLRHEVTTWNSFDCWTLGTQVVRAADSVGANIAEGHGRYGQRDERRFLLISRGSAYETEHWTERAVSRGLLSDEYPARAGEVSRMLNALLSRHL